jgi:hypothetical protein
MRSSSRPPFHLAFPIVFFPILKRPEAYACVRDNHQKKRAADGGATASIDEAQAPHGPPMTLGNITRVRDSAEIQSLAFGRQSRKGEFTGGVKFRYAVALDASC